MGLFTGVKNWWTAADQSPERDPAVRSRREGFADLQRRMTDTILGQSRNLAGMGARIGGGTSVGASPIYGRQARSAADANELAFQKLITDAEVQAKQMQDYERAA